MGRGRRGVRREDVCGEGGHFAGESCMVKGRVDKGMKRRAVGLLKQ